MKTLCIIYGIGRGIKTSSKDINNKIIDPLHNLCEKLDVVYVLNNINFIDNKRSGDYGNIPEVPHQIFNHETRLCFSKKELLRKDIFEIAKNVKDVHNDNYKSYENLLCQLGMLSEACKKKDFKLYDRILMIRDDLIIKSKDINFSLLLNIAEYGPITTMWHWHGGVGDRFLLCKPEIGVKFANRIDYVSDFIKNKGYLNGEHLQKYIIDTENLPLIAFNLKLIRVRLNFLVKENFLLPFWRPNELMRVFCATMRYNYRYLSYIIFNMFNIRRN